jgi:hypothetical protein
MNRPMSDLLPASDNLGAFLVRTTKDCTKCGNPFIAPLFVLHCEACEAAREAEQRASAEFAELKASGIPPQLLWAKPGAPELRERAPVTAVRAAVAKLGQLLEVARGQASTFKGTPVVLLAGPAGSGKTSIACSMLRVVIERVHIGRPAARFLGALEAERVMRENRLGTTDPPAIVQATRRPFVVLDDVGQESNDAATQVIKGIIANRHEKGRATVVTTGLPRRELAERYGGGFLRRVLSGGVIITVPGWGDYAP